MSKNRLLHRYRESLSNIALLSRLFSESNVPYIVSRSMERIYCEVFNAEDLGRADCSADAKKDNVGVGLKTFIHGNGRTLQKVAEFNRNAKLYKDKSDKELVHEVAKLRNERINFTKRTYGLDLMIYHCLTRKENEILIYEEKMDSININQIRDIKTKGNTISFNDKQNAYSFNKTKSTLYKRFVLEEPLLQFPVKIHNEPYKLLDDLMKINTDSMVAESVSPIYQTTTIVRDEIILPLFSYKKNDKYVPEKSGLNQWNASGRTRDLNEIYIPIPAWIHRSFPEFFPSRDQNFNLRIPNGEFLNVKVCQENSKALMSNPNKALGKWLLRQVLDLSEGEILTYSKLEEINIDSVIIRKVDNQDYFIDFTALGTYEQFKAEFNI